MARAWSTGARRRPSIDGGARPQPLNPRQAGAFLNTWAAAALLAGLALLGPAAAAAPAQVLPAGRFGPAMGNPILGPFGMPAAGNLVGPGGVSPFPANGSMMPSWYNPMNGYGGSQYPYSMS